MASKEIDRWLKAKIEKVPEDIIKFRDKKLESKMVYYTGNWQIDIMANLTQRQSEKIFNKTKRYIMKKTIQCKNFRDRSFRCTSSNC